jgi:electron transfer flavoprotein alpha subunit
MMAQKILVYVDHHGGEAVPASWEAVGVGREIAGTIGGGVTAVVVGENVAALAAQAIEYGADDAILVENPAFKEFRSTLYADVLKEVAGEAEVLLFPTTGRTRELAAMVAVDLETGLAPDVTGIEVRDGAVLATRPIYAGKLLCKVVCKESRPQIITLRSRAFPKPEPQSGKTGAVEKLEVEPGEAFTQVIGYKDAGGGVSLTDAAVIVSGGRGVSNNPSLTPPAEITDEKEQEIWRARQGFEHIRELADVLGAAVGASRAAVDAGYIPYANQVGQTGKVVSPDLYIACGISGAIQHLAGMRTAKTIVAINKDPDAPIFKLARFGVAGDLYEIVPALTKAFKDQLGK